MEKLGCAAFQERYRVECGVHTDRPHVYRWARAPAQALQSLRINEDINSHACGEYALEQLQRGVRPEAMAEALLREYLVKATKDRVLASR